ncbi:class II aldolase/adducin family protein [Mycobacterium sp. 663a-19]|uniref:class II aldolase/adducin family protein n=1 Tax=Mycobacterium sp. 663a-19 TaxID=2986148 RepID=UPI002D1EAF11|nr:class II aldolase/adducin family protein [Mycobacterium sp. 663a-19]MEB3980132.1 class II aldolase/adducin family protein [Mycobacterium sp. 663a-19]
MNDPIEIVVAASAALATAGLSDLVWGHASIRDPEGRGVWMKASGWAFEEIDAPKVVLVDSSGGVVTGQGRRHLEFPIHTEIMAARGDVGCVVHTHSAAVNAFASLGRDLHPISHDGVPFAYPQIPRFTETGALIATPELGRSLATALGDASAILIPNHGSVTVGPDAATAVMLSVLLESACRTELLAAAAGGPRHWSDERETQFKRDQAWNHTQFDAGWQYLVRRSSRTRQH